MSQTKDYKFTFRETLVKSYVLEELKLRTDLHTHGNANLSADILIALAIKHQIRYPLYYIKKLKLSLSPTQKAALSALRIKAEQSLDLTGLQGKYRERKIDDNTFLNFADLILCNPAGATENIKRIRTSLSILKDSQAVFTNLEKLYLYRYVFTKGAPADYWVALENLDCIEDADIRGYLAEVLHGIDPALSMHDLRIVPGATHTNILFDLVLPAGYKGEAAAVMAQLKEAAHRKNENYFCVIKIEQSYAAH